MHLTITDVTAVGSAEFPIGHAQILPSRGEWRELVETVLLVRVTAPWLPASDVDPTAVGPGSQGWLAPRTLRILDRPATPDFPALLVDMDEAPAPQEIAILHLDRCRIRRHQAEPLAGQRVEEPIVLVDHLEITYLGHNRAPAVEERQVRLPHLPIENPADLVAHGFVASVDIVVTAEGSPIGRGKSSPRAAQDNAGSGWRRRGIRFGTPTGSG